MREFSLLANFFLILFDFLNVFHDNILVVYTVWLNVI